MIQTQNLLAALEILKKFDSSKKEQFYKFQDSLKDRESYSDIKKRYGASSSFFFTEQEKYELIRHLSHHFYDSNAGRYRRFLIEEMKETIVQSKRKPNCDADKLLNALSYSQNSSEYMEHLEAFKKMSE